MNNDIKGNLEEEEQRSVVSPTPPFHFPFSIVLYVQSIVVLLCGVHVLKCIVVQYSGIDKKCGTHMVLYPGYANICTA